MRTTRKRAQGRSLGALTTTLVLALLVALLLAGTAFAATPGRPTAKTPTLTSVTTKPTFKWSKAARATRYEVRVYKGTTLKLKKTGITTLSWRCRTALTRGVSYSWKVRGRNTAGNGPWSASRTFRVRLAIGDAYQGGTVAYILLSGDPGYVAGHTHGLIAAKVDQSTGIRWYNGSFATTGATATALGTGLANTDAIIAAQGPTASSYAAGIARAYNGGYSDWYLPSRDELNKLYLNQAAIGGFGYPYYWSSSEFDAVYAWAQIIGSGDRSGAQDWGDKWRPNMVRAVRSF